MDNHLSSKTILSNKLVWIGLPKARQLAIVVSIRKNVADVRLYSKVYNNFRTQKETVTLSMLTWAELSKEEFAKIACGKRVLNKNRALQVVAVNLSFKDNENRKERRVYYCTRCEGFHTSSKRWLPKTIRDLLIEKPFNLYFKRSGKQYINSTLFHKWLRDEIGIKIGRNAFLKTLQEFEPDIPKALEILQNTPARYIEFVLYEHFHYENDRNNAVDDDMDFDHS